MSKNLTYSRKKWLQYKKEDPFGMKRRFVRDFIFRRFYSYANTKLNDSGWMFEENSDTHKLWKLYYVKLEEVNRIYCYKLSEYEKKHGRYNFKPTEELREIFKWYLNKNFELYQEALKKPEFALKIDNAVMRILKYKIEAGLIDEQEIF